MTYLKGLLYCAALALVSYDASGWTLNGSVSFSNNEAVGFAAVFSSELEEFPSTEVSVDMEEEGIRTDYDEDQCNRPAPDEPLVCSATAEDLSLSDGCLYCSDGHGIVYPIPDLETKSFRKCKVYNITSCGPWPN
ncbi:MAG: hypothetical protein KJO82_05725, partial [Gammaproteobacteria bacterium]|nr:hypothetical protein [Gammaproteobacteria bacterium]